MVEVNLPVVVLNLLQSQQKEQMVRCSIMRESLSRASISSLRFGRNRIKLSRYSLSLIDLFTAKRGVVYEYSPLFSSGIVERIECTSASENYHPRAQRLSSTCHLSVGSNLWRALAQFALSTIPCGKQRTTRCL